MQKPSIGLHHQWIILGRCATPASDAPLLLAMVVVRGFNADYGLFTTTSDGLLYPCPSADKLGAGLQLLEFL
eukprot:1137349-Pelagomonas_calceolata.AAC.2